MNNKDVRSTTAYILIILLISGLICYVSYSGNNPNLSIVNVIMPSLVALVVVAIFEGKKGITRVFKDQSRFKIGFKWLLLSLLGIPLIAALAVLVELNFELSAFGLRTSRLIPEMIVILIIGLGEEYGWRGFLQPRLMKKFSLFNASLLVGLIWGLWHFPAYLIGTGVPKEMNFLIFLLWVLLASLFIGWIYYHTQSVITSILVHISANASFNYLMLLPEFTGNMRTFYILILLLGILVFIIFYRQRQALFKFNGLYTDSGAE